MRHLVERRVLAWPILALLLLLPAALPAAAQEREGPLVIAPEPTIILADPNDAGVSFRPLGAPPQVPAEFGLDGFLPVGGNCGGSATPTSSFIITHSGTPANVQTAVACAVDILERRLVSAVPIRVSVTWSQLGSNVLGSAGPALLILTTSSPPHRIEPIALANAKAGSDLCPTSTSCGGQPLDVVMNLSSNFANWYLGTDGATPAGKWDLVTVAIHELLHGVGFLSTYTRNAVSQLGRWGLLVPLPGGQQRVPTYFDSFVENGSGQSLLNTSLFPNSSTALGTQLISQNLFFDGPLARAANGGTAPRLYAPTTFNQGSSISHLDDSTFHGSIDALMTPSISSAEADHDLGPVVSGVLRDIGWELAEYRLAFDQQPANGAPGVLSPQPRIEVLDAGDDVLTTDSATVVTLSLQGTGTLTCTGGLSKTVTSGVATFAGCSVTSSGTFRVIATATAVTPITGAQSSQFTLSGGGVSLGRLRVVTSPPGEGTIFVDGIPRDTWGLDWVEMEPGTYTVSFSQLPGRAAAPPQEVTVTAGQTTTVTGLMPALPVLRVITSPAVASTILVDGVPRDDWGIWVALPGESHEVCFGPVPGFEPPPCQEATMTAGQVTEITGVFTPSEGAPGPTGKGLLRVVTSPAVSATILVDGIERDAWGLDWTQLDPGNYTVSFSDVPGYATPAPQQVTVSAGQTTSVTGTFTSLAVLSVITDPPVDARVLVGGIPRDNWGIWVPMSPGAIEVCFAQYGGVTPACQQLTLTAGVTSTVTADYDP